MLEGDISVTSTPGKGSTFNITSSIERSAERKDQIFREASLENVQFVKRRSANPTLSARIVLSPCECAATRSRAASALTGIEK